MSYLHSRGIVHGRLNSRNIFLESKVKLSILDHSMVQPEEESELGYAKIARHTLNTLPPEVRERHREGKSSQAYLKYPSA